MRTLVRYGLLLVLLVTAQAHAGPTIEHWNTSNGAKVLFVSAPEIPMMDVRMTFAAGSARDGAKKGIANLTNALLREGAGERDTDAFSDALGRTGAKLQHNALRDMAYIGIRTLTDPKYAGPALTLLKDAVASPRFDSDAVSRLKAQQAIGFRHKQQSPATVAEEAFFAKLYGDHPYASPTDGTAETVAALTPADLKAFHAQYYVANNAVIAIVGAIDKAHAERVAEDLSQTLPSGTKAAALPAVQMTSQSENAVEFPSIQSHVRVGLPGMWRGDPDYFPLLVGNHVLGGNSLVSLLFQEVRAKRGLSYSAYSYFRPMAAAGPFVAVLQTDRASQDEALTVLNQTLADFINEGPPAEALQSAKQNLIGGFPLRVDSNDKIAEYISMIGFYDLPLDYLETFSDKVAAVDAEAVREAFSRRVPLNKLVTVVVGRKDVPAEN